MLPDATDRILALPADAEILDVGGWAAPFNRATWVIDAMPYESRGAMGFSYGGDQEHFGADTWVQTDFCAREPWPFEDDQFDLVMCVTTLEDIRDPIWVCPEMSRVAKAGYIEVPSVLNELTWDIPGEGKYVGNRHHHWFCAVTQEDPANGVTAAVDFIHKQHNVHADPSIRVSPAMAEELKLTEKLQSLYLDRRGQGLRAAADRRHAQRLPASAGARAFPGDAGHAAPGEAAGSSLPHGRTPRSTAARRARVARAPCPRRDRRAGA